MFPIEAGDINPENRIIPHLPGEKWGWVTWVGSPAPAPLICPLTVPSTPTVSGLDLASMLTGPLVSFPGPASPAVV